MAAFERAIELGVEMIEADVNITSDGQLVMIHDFTLDRTTTGHGRVSGISWADLRGLDAGARFHEDFLGERVPLVDDILGLAKRHGISLCLEVKGADVAEAFAIAERLADRLGASDALDWAFMSGYDHVALGYARARASRLQLAPDRIPDNVLADPAEAIRQARAIDAAALQNHHAFLTRDLVDALHAQDIAVWSWPTTDEPSLVSSIAAGADGLMGDDVRTMVSVIARSYPDVAEGPNGDDPAGSASARM
jgi:glycerophosphoryl diester phosphodiesterase